MEFRIALEWDAECGISLIKMYPFRESIEELYVQKDYGKSISVISIVLTCRDRDFHQRKRFKKAIGRFSYDILLDFFLIKNLEIEDKKKLIRYQFIKISVETFSKYKFEDFDKNRFLEDLKRIVNDVEW